MVLNGFQSTRSSGTATQSDFSHFRCWAYFNPRGPLGPRRRTDWADWGWEGFNPRGPLGPRRHRQAKNVIEEIIHAVLWDRDRKSKIVSMLVGYFNPRGPLGPRRYSVIVCVGAVNSIHAVLWDRDVTRENIYNNHWFQSTRSSGTATARLLSRFCREIVSITRSSGTATSTFGSGSLRVISIHAVLWDRDDVAQLCPCDRADFNPRGPLGPRPCKPHVDVSCDLFQSTRSSGTATRFTTVLVSSFQFQSTRSSGTATQFIANKWCWMEISIHAVLWDRDCTLSATDQCQDDFNPRGPLGPRLCRRENRQNEA